MVRPLALLAGFAVSLLAVAGAGGAATQQTPKRGGTVVVATNSLAEPPCLGWDPSCLGRWQWGDKVLAPPFRQGPYGLRNDLVTRVGLAEDPFTVTFHIRPQARWSDGVPITAQDFAFAYRTHVAHWGLDFLPEDHPLRTKIRRVEAVDRKTVRFVFRSRYGDWKLLLNNPPLPRHALRGEDLAASEDFWRNGIVNPKTGQPIGSGPFLVGPWQRGTQFTLLRNPRYWGGHAAYVDRIVLRFVRGDRTADGLRSGEFDLGVVLPGDLDPDPRFTMRTTPWSNWEHFEVRVDRGGHPALRKKLVRRALAYGIDRVALVRAQFGASATAVLDNTIFLSSERSYEPNWSRYRYRPAEARRLLEQAGCSRGVDGIYSCAGERLQLRFFTTAAVPRRQLTLEVVTAQLRRAGIEVVPVYAPNVQLFETILPGGEFDVALFGGGKSAPGEVSSPYRCGDESYGGYCSRLVTADLDQLDRILEPARRVEVANRVDRRLAADVPALPLFQPPLVYVVRKGLHGVVPNGFGVLTTGGSLWNAENWWLDR